MAGSIITQDELKKILHYNPDTGIFTRLVNFGTKKKSGEIVSNISSSGYSNITINYKNYYAHRLAWLYIYGYFPKNQIDHINGIKSDNRICNLREADNCKNQLNTKLQSRNSSGHKGVSWLKSKNRWRVLCSVNKTRYYLGLFKNIEDAKSAYDNFAKIHHGDFYRDASHPTVSQTVSAQDLIALKSAVVILQADSNVE